MIISRPNMIASSAMAALIALGAPAVRAQSTPVTVVLVHGAWADASSWNPVIAELQKQGIRVVAPPNMLRGLKTDASVIATYVKTIPGPVILVGHSYGGAVISVASAEAKNVKALVYVDGFVPDTGESCLSLLAGGPPPPDLFIAVPFATATGGDADLYLNPKYYGAVFSSDQPANVSALMTATQRPLTHSALTEAASAAEGWKTIPSWYVIGDADMVIPPKAQLSMATRAKAKISHAPGAAHPSMLSPPDVSVQRRWHVGLGTPESRRRGSVRIPETDASEVHRARRRGDGSYPYMQQWLAHGILDRRARLVRVFPVTAA